MVEVYPDIEALSRAAAQLFADQARRAVRERGRFLALLSGGDTPGPSYRLLAQEPLRGSIPWQDVHLFWGDERWVPLDDPHSNYLLARQTFIDAVPLAPSQVHPVPFEASPRLSAARYEELLRGFFRGAPPRFDLALQGLGDNGHTASLFPGSSALNETARWVCETNQPHQGLYRVTLTPQVINQAALVVFLVAGARKAAVLRRVLEEGADPAELPARAIRPDKGTLLWLVDREAARLLDQRLVHDRSGGPGEGASSI